MCFKGEALYNFESGKEYAFDYQTNTTLWINDVSDEAKSSLILTASVFISQIDACTYSLRLDKSTLTGSSIDSDDAAAATSQLNSFNTVFKLNSEGELDATVKFQPGDQYWARNIKRAIISAFQVKSAGQLRSLDYLDAIDTKSAVVYETDILGRCRTTYDLHKENYVAGKSLHLHKKKSLQGCNINESKKTGTVQFVPYKSIAVRKSNKPMFSFRPIIISKIFLFSIGI